jgi:hypothetical protein
MVTSPFIQGNLGYLNNYDNNIAQPGITPNPYGVLSSAAQSLATPNPQASTLTSSTGADALMSKAKGDYSNKQFIAPFSYTQNVEGTMIQVDYLGKKVKTNSSVSFRSIVSLSATALPITLINDPNDNNPDRVIKTFNPSTFTGSPTKNVATQIFGTGTSAVTQSLAGRTQQFSSLIQQPTGQLFSNLAASGPAAITGQLQNLIPFSNINQSIANLPGFSVATNALGQLPGGSNIVGALTNPVGAASGLIQQTLSDSIQLQGGLPSVSLGSLGDAFSLAANIASSGPPTSLTGIISLEKQIKSIVCNFTLPIINIPPYDAILKFTFPKPQDIFKQVKKQLNDLKANIINQFDIVKQLKNILPDPHEIYDAVIKEITTCDKKPSNANNTKNGKAGG